MKTTLFRSLFALVMDLSALGIFASLIPSRHKMVRSKSTTPYTLLAIQRCPRFTPELVDAPGGMDIIHSIC